MVQFKSVAKQESAVSQSSRNHQASTKSVQVIGSDQNQLEWQEKFSAMPLSANMITFYCPLIHPPTVPHPIPPPHPPVSMWMSPPHTPPDL